MRGEITSTRFDVNYWRLSALVEARLRDAAYPPRAFGELLSLVQYGSSKLASSEPIGVSILRMNNLQEDGWDLTDLKWVELSASELDTYRLQQEDVLFNRTNSKELVGKCEVFREPGEWVFASYLIRVRTNEKEINPQFACDFLNGPTGRLQIDQLSRQIIGMTNINAEEIRSIRIPLPAPARQLELVASMDRARKERAVRMQEAAALLAGLDQYILDILSLAAIPQPKRTFAIRAGELTGVMNPDRYRGLQVEKHVPFKGMVSQIGQMLEARCSPERDAPKELWDWIRIDDLPNQPWQVEALRTETGENIRGTFFEVQEGDILVARLGPTIQNAKFVLCPKLKRQTIASSEFLVLRCGPSWLPDAVLWVLRTRLYREIMYARSRGATPSRFRLDGDDLMTIPFPTIDLATQERIASEAHRRRGEARRLREEAEANWAGAKRWFEEQLLDSTRT